MSSPGANGRRRDMDLFKLMNSNHEVHMIGNSSVDFHVKFRGPATTLYDGGVWQISVHLPEKYPFHSPSIGFMNRIFHPNIDERSGTVCLDTLNTTWTPIYDLIHIFEIFLPQLLTYPNPSDPLNHEAAKMLLNSPEEYKGRIKKYISLYATEAALKMTGNGKAPNGKEENTKDSEDSSDLSDLSETEPEQ